MLYRWLLALYFLAWFFYTLVEAHSIGIKYFIYLTHWGFIIWNLYLTTAAIVVTVNFIEQVQFEHSIYRRSKRSNLVHNVSEATTDQEGRCWRHDFTQDMTTWKEKIQWVLFTIGLEFAVGISILFWFFFYDSNRAEVIFSPSSLHVHFINGVTALTDLWVVGIPVRLLHVLYVLLFGSLYAVFTGLYYVLNGTDPAGNHYIYPMLNYGHDSLLGSSLLIGCTLGFLVFLHILFFCQYLVRSWITFHIHRRFTIKEHALL